ncbi:transcriptional regulator [Furfurilactobacillus sp. OKN36]
MTYSVTELANLAGISTRTLRFYETKGLLTAQRHPENNYRYYDETAVNQLQKIMFLRLFDLPLSKIILQSSEADQYQALNEQRIKIIAEQARLTNLLTSLNQTLATMKGVSIMTDTEKFAAFKTKAISDNEDQYGKEIRKQYGTDVINRSNQKFNAFSEEESTHLQQLTQEILTALQPLVGTHDFDQPAAKAIFDLHKVFLTMTWPDMVSTLPKHTRAWQPCMLPTHGSTPITKRALVKKGRPKH